jgi:hypothetical protein
MVGSSAPIPAVDQIATPDENRFARKVSDSSALIEAR